MVTSDVLQELEPPGGLPQTSPGCQPKTDHDCPPSSSRPSSNKSQTAAGESDIANYTGCSHSVAVVTALNLLLIQTAGHIHRQATLFSYQSLDEARQRQV